MCHPSSALVADGVAPAAVAPPRTRVAPAATAVPSFTMERITNHFLCLTGYSDQAVMLPACQGALRELVDRGRRAGAPQAARRTAGAGAREHPVGLG
ncbi:exported hypothetical protein [Phycicoccus elongatus Lp2]|uniref:Uncharacterized protein n=1 Tax=Phycicoccus elongatus Lp2 TaxID=1193181 RepID=N0E3Z7_9MICO|nr:exported hypothetical protein [Phycicoccus elongatus Lp2]